MTYDATRTLMPHATEGSMAGAGTDTIGSMAGAGTETIGSMAVGRTETIGSMEGVQTNIDSMGAAGSKEAVLRLGFAGVGWIGLNRMQEILLDGQGAAAVLVDPSPDAIEAARTHAPEADASDQFDRLLESDVDAVVIATPSGLHAAQAVRALEAGKPVFCQKPLGRTADETTEVCRAARSRDLLLGVDLSYRFTAGLRAARESVRSGAIGDVYAADLTFHNAYGPANTWARDPELAGGGCVIDLGVHLIDALLWTLEEARITDVAGGLFQGGRRLRTSSKEIEDFAQVQLELSGGRTARLTCSWHFAPGCDADIEVSFHGTDGSASFRNQNGSFYDFVAELRRGARTEVLAEPPDAWGGRAAVEWVRRVAAGDGYDPEVEGLIEVSRTIDLIYGRGLALDLMNLTTKATAAG